MAEPAAIHERPPLILASASPRRRALLAMLGVEVDVMPADLDEVGEAEGLAPADAVVALARAKVSAVHGDGRPVLGADTEVTLDGEALGKPRDRCHAEAMLRRQAGRQLEVVSAVAVRAPDGTIEHATATSVLSVATLDDAAIAVYLQSGEADDKAGALAVQGSASRFVTIVNGSRSNVFGLPLAETAALLRAVGVEMQQHRTLGL